MPFVPRTLTMIRNTLLNAIKPKTGLTDVSESSVLFGIVSAIAEEFESIEYRLKAIRDSFDLDLASGLLLDERVSELPAKSYTRLSGSAAAGSVMTLSRTATSDPNLPGRTINAGSLFSREDNPAVSYTLSSSITFLVDQTEYPNAAQNHAPVKCTVPGTIGNADANVITKIVDDLSGVLTSVTNTIPVGGGRSQESDAELRVRAKSWLNSLARSQRSALINRALDYQPSSSAGTSTFKSVAIFEDPTVPGRVELIVDDGTGELPTVSDVSPDYGVIPLNLSPILNHKFPLTREVDTIYKYQKPAGAEFDPTVHLTVDQLGDAATWHAIQIWNNPGAWVSHHERGVVILGPMLKEVTAANNEFMPGDVWMLQYSDTSAGIQLVGEPVAGLQKSIEGSSDPSLDFPGYRAAGIRVIVSAPEATFMPFNAAVTFEPGATITTVVDSVKTRIVDFCTQLGPGQTLYLSRLISDLVANIFGLKAVQFISGINGLGVTGDMTPGSEKRVIRAGTITVS